MLAANPSRPVRVLVVDDSAVMRAAIVRALHGRAGLAVVAQAADTEQAREAIRLHKPDVLTLDVDMPGTGGLVFLDRLMRLCPLPVVIVSSLTRRGAEITMRALELGAFDCVAKPRTGEADPFGALAAVVRAAAHAKPRAQRLKRRAPPEGYQPGPRLLAIGASTGGVEALMAILPGFPRACPPTVIAQHIPPTFAHTLAERLDRACEATVSLAGDGAALTAGRIYLAPGEPTHLAVEASPIGWRCRLLEGNAVNGHYPSVDVLFGSVARAAGGRGVALLLTGMGRDGARGLLAVRDAGGRTLTQDEQSSVVYGMPRAAWELGAAERQVPLREAALAVLEACRQRVPVPA